MSQTREEISAYNKSYHKKHREEILARQKQFKIKNKEHVLTRDRNYRIKHARELLARDREYKKTNREKIREQERLRLKELKNNNPAKYAQRLLAAKEWKTGHRKQVNQTAAEWRKKNIEKCRVREINYYYENKEKILLSMKRSRECNRNELLKKKRLRYRRFRNQILAEANTYYANNHAVCLERNKIGRKKREIQQIQKFLHEAEAKLKGTGGA